jgi:uncharacterized membrane protein
MVLDMYKTGTDVAGKATYNWTSVWLVPAAIAMVVLVLFVLFFSERNGRNTSAKKAEQRA